MGPFDMLSFIFSSGLKVTIDISVYIYVNEFVW